MLPTIGQVQGSLYQTTLSLIPKKVNNLLHTAADWGDLNQAQSVVGLVDINAKGGYGATALLKASYSGHAKIVELILTFNPDVNIPDVSTISASIIHVTPSPLTCLLFFLLSVLFLFFRLLFSQGAWFYSLDLCVRKRLL